KKGRVQKKNNWAESSPHDVRAGRYPPYERRRTSPGYRHLLKRSDLERFIDLLPDWDELAIGLRTVVLDDHEDAMGWHNNGVVAICAWEEELWWDDARPSFIEEHRKVFRLLGVGSLKTTTSTSSNGLTGRRGPFSSSTSSCTNSATTTTG